MYLLRGCASASSNNEPYFSTALAVPKGITVGIPLTKALRDNCCSCSIDFHSRIIIKPINVSRCYTAYKLTIRYADFTQNFHLSSASPFCVSMYIIMLLLLNALKYLTSSASPITIFKPDISSGEAFLFIA